jgi:GntR family transcriptional regulator, arabinose operon transcriptional repressor
MTHVSDVVISPHSAISLHAQLYSQLRQLIVSGRWAGGARLPSESQFSEHLDISRSTVRLALHQAEAEGLIERIAGRGSFVRYQPRPEHGSRLITFLTSSFDVGSHLHMLRGAENEVKAHGYQISFNHVQSYQEELEILQQLQAGGSAGVLLWPNAGTPAHEPGIAALYQQLKLPLVLLDRPIPDINRDCVTSNNYAGAIDTSCSSPTTKRDYSRSNIATAPTVTCLPK